ncbi:substrate-binding domain-containing protein [Paenibacillus alkalitolerans]|uniref:substrate-binding domain-containing protein n=1 Tax=Paenibacillus alkalitolerans TaxID=2799335 RepID=UPI0018F33478|nr:substrate-binding domain-containing protein [Paenibacillus alkalitolerans]
MRRGGRTIFRAAALLTVMALLFTACAGDEELNVPQAPKKKIAMVVKMMHGDYWNTVRMGAETAAREFNAELLFAAPEEETDIDGQIRIVRQFVEEDVDALVLAASDYMALGRVTDQAGNAGIPVISIDSEVASTKVRSYIGANNYVAGRQAGMELVEHTGDNSRVAIVSFVEGARNASQREEGLLDLLAQYSGVTVVDMRYSESDLTTAEQVTRDILKKHGTIDGIVALNAIATSGVTNVIRQMGLEGKVKVVGFDSTSDIMEMLQEGVIQSTIVQNAFTMGYLGVKHAIEATEGMKLPERVDSGTVIIDTENMFFEENQKLLFPFVK